MIGNVQCWIEKEGSRTSTITDVSDIMSNDTFTKFWISWHSSQIQFGSAKDGVPIVSRKISVRDIQFITFASYEDRGPLQWKLICKLYMQIINTVTFTYHDLKQGLFCH